MNNDKEQRCYNCVTFQKARLAGAVGIFCLKTDKVVLENDGACKDFEVTA